MKVFVSQNPMSVFGFLFSILSSSKPSSNLSLNLGAGASNSKLETFEAISSRKVSLCLCPSITQLNVHVWLSIVVASSRKISLWVMMSFSKAETLERICSLLNGGLSLVLKVCLFARESR